MKNSYPVLLCGYGGGLGRLSWSRALWLFIFFFFFYLGFFFMVGLFFFLTSNWHSIVVWWFFGLFLGSQSGWLCRRFLWGSSWVSIGLRNCGATGSSEPGVWSGIILVLLSLCLSHALVVLTRMCSTAPVGQLFELHCLFFFF